MLNKPIFRLKAFSLIEISLTLLILGIVASSGMYLFKALNAQYKYQTKCSKASNNIKCPGCLCS